MWHRCRFVLHAHIRSMEKVSGRKTEKGWNGMQTMYKDWIRFINIEQKGRYYQYTKIFINTKTNAVVHIIAYEGDRLTSRIKSNTPKGRGCNPDTRLDFLPAVPSVLFTSPGMVWVLFLNLTEQPKSPSLIKPDEVRKMLAPDTNEQYEKSKLMTADSFLNFLRV